MKTFCFDLDGVICKTKKNNYKSAKPIKKIITLINKLYIKKQNYNIYSKIHGKVWRTYR